jgi:hypothetical protein
MATMIDEIFDRAYQAGRSDLNAGIGAVFARAGEAFRVLHRIEFEAPWLARQRKARRA